MATITDGRLPSAPPQLAPPAPQDVDGPGIGEYLGVFKRRPLLIIVPIIVFTIVGGVVAFIVSPQYESMTRFKILDPGVVKDVIAFSQPVLPHKQILNTMEADIKRRPFLEPIIRKIGLTEGYDIGNPEGLADFYKYIEKALSVTASRVEQGSDTVSITYRGRDPNKVVQFVTEVRNSYRDAFREEYREMSQGFYEKAKARRDDLKSHWTTLNSQYQAFLDSEDVRLISLRQTLEKEFGDLKEDEREFEQTIRGLGEQLRQLDADLRSQEKETKQKNFVPNPAKAQNRSIWERLQAELDRRIAQGYTDLVVGMKELREQVAQARLDYEREEENVGQGYTLVANPNYQKLVDDKNEANRDLLASESNVQAVRTRMAVIRESLGAIPDLASREADFRTRIQIQSGLVEEAERKFEKLRSTWESVRGRGSDLFKIVDDPRVDPPVFPSVPLFLGIGAGVGLLLGIGIAFLKEFSGMTYVTSSQVQHSLPLTILGEVGRITTEAERRAERWRRIRSTVIFVVVLGTLAGLHLMYFNKAWSKNLPPFLVEVLDKVYLGR